MIGPLALVGLVVAAPLVQLSAWAVESISEDVLPPEFGAAARNSLLLATVGALLIAAVGTLLGYGLRASGSRLSAAAVRVATIGYGLPGSVVAVAVIAPLGWLDERFGALILTGSVIGLLAAYLLRFLGLAFQAVESSLERVPRSLDEAARGLGADRLDVLARVHMPLMKTGLLTACLLVFTEVMKELPATLLLRPLERGHAGRSRCGRPRTSPSSRRPPCPRS